MRDEFRKPIAWFLQCHGINEYCFNLRRKHDSVEFLLNGRPFTFFFPCSGSDWRGPANAIAQLKRLTGLTGEPANDNNKRKPRRRSRHRRPASKRTRRWSAGLIEAPLVRDDRWFSHLQIIRKRLVAGGERAVAASNANDNRTPATPSCAEEHGGERIRLIRRGSASAFASPRSNRQRLGQPTCKPEAKSEKWRMTIPAARISS